MQKGPNTPKGFNDLPPVKAKKKREFINTIVPILERYGFSPLETPIIEFSETLLGKYGEDEKLIYQFEDKGGRKLALRYDLTVPLARYVANNLACLSPTFARYQIGQVFRGEKPQKGRSRELTQFDCDIVGSNDPSDDARVIACSIESVKSIGFNDARMAINDRTNFKSLTVEEIRIIDKIHKVGRENTPEKLINFVDKSMPTKNLEAIFAILEEKYALIRNEDFFFDPTLARGLDYYTGVIFEMKPCGNPEDLSIGGGGRYDNLIGIFAKKDIPAVGFSFGIDRILELSL